jgi:hypothetical protein
MVVRERSHRLSSIGYTVLGLLVKQRVGESSLITFKINETVAIFLHLERWGALKVVLRILGLCSLALERGW